jgi:hypothetical protein
MKDAALRATAGMQVSTADFAATVAAQYAGEVLFVYDVALDGFAARISNEGAQALAASPAVERVEPNRVVRVEPTADPDIADIDAQSTADVQQVMTVEHAQIGPMLSWGIDRIDQRLPPLDGAFTPYATGKNVNVYVIDTGLRGSHYELSGRVQAGYTAVNDGNDTWDCHGHGTHVAGTIAGRSVGVARDALVYPVRVLDACGGGTDAQVIAGLNFVAANGRMPAVANMSLGGLASTSLDTAVKNVVRAGVTVVVAAGNSNRYACLVSPARVPEAITVGATDVFDWRAAYSNWGSCVDLFAPGSGITSAWNTADWAYITLNGTSMASPHVAGAAAVYLSSNPSATPAQVVQQIAATATAGYVAMASSSPNRLLYVGPPAPQPPAPVICSNELDNGSFEEGPAKWSQFSLLGFPLICKTGDCEARFTPKTGSYMAWLGGEVGETAILSQTVNLPAGGNVGLAFWMRSTSDDLCGYDSAHVLVEVEGAIAEDWTYPLCRRYNGTGWQMIRKDLSDYSGMAVKLQFLVETDDSFVSSLWLDDVAVMKLVGCVPPSVTSAEEETGLLNAEEQTPDAVSPRKTLPDVQP